MNRFVLVSLVVSSMLGVGLVGAEEPAAVRVVATAETAPARSAEVAPGVLVERFHEALLGVMREAKTLGLHGRYEKLAPIVGNTFNLGLMIRIASGSHWRKGNDDERERVIEAFERMSIATYADRFNGFSGQSFVTIRGQDGPQKTYLVETVLKRPDGDPVEITYVFRKTDEGWRAIDVLLAGGVSELARYRSDFSKTLRDGGLSALAIEIDAKATATLGPTG